MSTSPDSPVLPVALNANQRRHYGILITGLETTLDKIETALAPARPPTGLKRLAADLPPAFHAAAPRLLAHVRVTLQRMARGLSLESHPASERQTCRALLTSEIERIEESYSTQLRGYGAVDDSVGTVLDPILGDVRRDLGTLVSLLAVPKQ